MSELLSALLGVSVYAMPDGRATVHIDAGATKSDRKRFAQVRAFLDAGGRLGLPSVAEPVDAIDERVGPGFAIDERVVGTSMDIASLDWSITRRVAFFEAVCRAVQRMHREGLHQGTLTPAHVLISGELTPLVLGPDISFARFAPYGAPEARDTQGVTSPAGDVFSLGRYLAFLLSGESPADSLEDPPPLAELRRQPEGLVRIIRACCRRMARDRYRDVDSLLADLAHWREPGSVGVADGLNAQTIAASRRDPLQTEAGSVDLPVGFGARLALLIVGVGVGLLGGWLSFVGHGEWSGWVSGAGLGAAVAGALPPMSRLQRAARFAFFACAMLVFAQLDPLAAVRVEGARGRLLDRDPGVRAAAAVAMVAEGERDLFGANLRDAPLDGADLADAELGDADLRGASLVGADLCGAQLDGARLEEAALDAADLSGAHVDDGLEASTCDEATMLPEPYACVDGSPQVLEVEGPEDPGELADLDD